MISILNRKATKDELEGALEYYGDYIKTVIDTERKLLAIGGEYHIDCEEVLLQTGSKQENLYGGGYRISTKEVEYMALSNYKPAFQKYTYEIADPKIRDLLYELTKEYLD